MGSVLAILQLIEAIAPQLIGLGTQAVEAFQANDQVKLDAIHAQARAAADALKPAGA
jgi:hypothetical protein